MGQGSLKATIRYPAYGFLLAPFVSTMHRFGDIHL